MMEMCEKYYCFRPMREIEEQIIEDCNLSDISVEDVELDQVSGLFVLTVSNPREGDLSRMEKAGWLSERAV